MPTLRPAPTEMRLPTDEVAFGIPYERDGITVLPAAAVRRHTATGGPSAQPRRLDAALSGVRPLGAFVVRRGRVRWHPAVDVTRVITTTEVVVGAVLVAGRLARRPSGAKAAVSMGPGGWVSMKGGAMAVRPAGRAWRSRRDAEPARRGSGRPWWAKLLSAKSLQSLLRL